MLARRDVGHRCETRRRSLRIESLETRALLSHAAGLGAIVSDAGHVAADLQSAEIAPSQVKSLGHQVSAAAAHVLSQVNSPITSHRGQQGSNSAVGQNITPTAGSSATGSSSATKNMGQDDSQNDPPYIEDFYCISDGSGKWTISGDVGDDNYPVQGDPVTFGGVLASYNLQTTVNADGTFAFDATLVGLQSGIATAQATGPGGVSDPAETWVFVG